MFEEFEKASGEEKSDAPGCAEVAVIESTFVRVDDFVVIVAATTTIIRISKDVIVVPRAVFGIKPQIDWVESVICYAFYGALCSNATRFWI